MNEQDVNLPPADPQLPSAAAPQWPAPGAAPVAALPYSAPMPTYSRPANLTAISVISIVVACLSTVASLGMGCQAGSFYMMSKMVGAMKTSGAFATTSTTTGASTTMTTPGGTITITPTTSPAASPVITPPGAAPSGTPIVVPAGTGVIAATQPATGTNALTASEVAGAVKRAQIASGNKLNAAQMSALSTALQDPNQTLVSPGTAWSPVQTANVNPDGSVFITFTGGFVSVDAQGKITLDDIGAMMPNFSISGTTCLFSIVEALLSIGLAIFLFVAAIMMMRNAPSARRPHLIFAVLKIPLAITAGVTIGLMYHEMYVGMTGGLGGTAAFASLAGWIWGLSVGGVGLIYPIALLMALNTRPVRAFYNAVR